MIKSALYSPSLNIDILRKGAVSGADLLICDLEDSIKRSDKDLSRSTFFEFLKNETKTKKAVRINSVDTIYGVNDIHSIIHAKESPDYIVLPKTVSSYQVKMIDKILDDCKSDIRLFGLIESIEGVDNINEIAESSKRLDGLMFGAADFRSEVGCDANSDAIKNAQIAIVKACAKANIQSLDSPFFDLKNTPNFIEDVKHARSLGFGGKCAIHPSQISVINSIFMPSKEEIEKAVEILKIAEQGVGVLDGKMIDEAYTKSARRVLERAGVLKKQERSSSMPVLKVDLSGIELSTKNQHTTMSTNDTADSIKQYMKISDNVYREQSGLYWDDFKVGDVFEHRPGRTVLDVDNVWFTLLTMNTQQVHFDQEYADKTEWKKLLVDSTFTLALVTGMSVKTVSAKVVANLGWDKVKMPKPVFAGDTIYAVSKVISKRESKKRPTQGIVTVETKGINQRGEVVIQFERTMLVYKKGHSPEEKSNY